MPLSLYGRARCMAAVSRPRPVPFFLTRPVLLASRLGDVNSRVPGTPGMCGPGPVHAPQAGDVAPSRPAGAGRGER